MTLQSAIERVLPRLRAEAEALMVDEFEMRDYGEGWSYSPTEGKDVRNHEVLFTSPGRILTSTSPREAEVGGRTSAVIDRVLHLPASKPGVPVGTVAHRLSDHAEFTVLADVTHPQPKSRRLQVEEALS